MGYFIMAAKDLMFLDGTFDTATSFYPKLYQVFFYYIYRFSSLRALSIEEQRKKDQLPVHNLLPSEPLMLHKQ